MKRFAFRLERLRRLRELERREARAALARALDEVAQREAELEAASGHFREALAFEPPQEAANRPESWKRIADWQAGLQARLRAARAEQRVAEQDAERSREAHRDAEREYGVLERLREKRRRAWRTEVEREEQRFLDEMHLLRAARQPRHGMPEESVGGAREE